VDEALRQRVGQLFHQRWGQLGVDGLLPPERDYVLLWVLYAEVGNGGFDQYLSNSSGDYAAETVAALERYGYRDQAAALRLALDLLPGGWCADRAERQRRLGAVPGRWDVYDLLSEEYQWALGSDAKREPPAEGEVDEAILAAYQREGLLVGPAAPVDAGGT
jgi:hypothetical protein